MTDFTTAPDTFLTAVLRAAEQLTLAGRFDEALAMLDACPTGSHDDEVQLALAASDTALRCDHVRGGSSASARLEPLERLLSEAGDATSAQRWDARLLRVRADYGHAMIRDDGSLRFGPEGREPREMAALLADAERLHATAPDDVRRGWASMCLGWINDNVLGRRDDARPHFEAALGATRDDEATVLRFEAQRHLGDHDHDDGDREAALARWRDSATAAAGAGHVTGTLAQQLLLAQLAREAGDEGGTVLLASEVARWAGAVGAERLRGQALGLLAGEDPTQDPTQETPPS